MHTKILLILFLTLNTLCCCTDYSSKKEYLETVLKNLDKIETASYTEIVEQWHHGDTVAAATYLHLVKEYAYPSDTTIGSKFVVLDKADSTMLFYGYDGLVRANAYHENEEIVVDDFTARPLPFRPTSPPFFNYTKSIIKYATVTNDSIKFQIEDLKDSIYLKLVIYEENQIEFFGKPFRIPISPYSLDNTSIYEIWIDKATDLPYKVRREMSHNISVTICKDIKLNRLNINNFKLNDYFPENYKIIPYGKRSSKPAVNRLTGKPAPNWALVSTADSIVNIEQLKSKVLLIQFTSVNCGPCRLSVEFLKKVNESYSKSDVDVIAIECTSKNLNVLKTYSKRNKFDYKFLLSTKEVTTDYSISSFPVFFILNEERIVQKVIDGYAKEHTDRKIKGIIESLI